MNQTWYIQRTNRLFSLCKQAFWSMIVQNNNKIGQMALGSALKSNKQTVHQVKLICWKPQTFHMLEVNQYDILCLLPETWWVRVQRIAPIMLSHHIKRYRFIFSKEWQHDFNQHHSGAGSLLLLKIVWHLWWICTMEAYANNEPHTAHHTPKCTQHHKAMEIPSMPFYTFMYLFWFSCHPK